MPQCECLWPMAYGPVAICMVALEVSILGGNLKILYGRKKWELLTASKQKLIILHCICSEEQRVVCIKWWLQFIPLRSSKGTAEEYQYLSLINGMWLTIIVTTYRYWYKLTLSLKSFKWTWWRVETWNTRPSA